MPTDLPSHSKSVLRRLMLPMALMLTLLIIGPAALLWHQVHSNDRLARTQESIAAEFTYDLRNTASGMELALQVLAGAPRVISALQAVPQLHQQTAALIAALEAWHAEHAATELSSS